MSATRSHVPKNDGRPKRAWPGGIGEVVRSRAFLVLFLLFWFFQRTYQSHRLLNLWLWYNCWYNWNRRSIGVYSRKWLESLKEVVNEDTDKEAQVPASVFIIADCWIGGFLDWRILPGSQDSGLQSLPQRLSQTPLRSHGHGIDTPVYRQLTRAAASPTHRRMARVSRSRWLAGSARRSFTSPNCRHGYPYWY